MVKAVEGFSNIIVNDLIIIVVRLKHYHISKEKQVSHVSPQDLSGHVIYCLVTLDSSITLHYMTVNAMQAISLFIAAHAHILCLQDFLSLYQRGGGEACTNSVGLQDAIWRGDV